MVNRIYFLRFGSKRRVPRLPSSGPDELWQWWHSLEHLTKVQKSSKNVDGDDGDDHDATITTTCVQFSSKFQFASTRSIWSENRQNLSHPRDFSAV